MKDNDINNFIYDLVVDEWNIYEQKDAEQYFRKPTSRI
jgi:hypothetical protein